MSWLAADEAPSQIKGAQFLKHVPKLTFNRSSDIFHVLHNIMKFAVRQAKLWSCYVQAASVLNGLYAPHNSNTNKNKVEDMAAACTHKLQQDSPTVLQFYPRTLVDRRKHNSADRNTKGKVGRQKFVGTLDVALKGNLQNK